MGVAYEEVTRKSESAQKQQGYIQLFLNEKLDDQYNMIDDLENKIIQINTNHKFEKEDLINKFKDENDGLKAEIAEIKSDLKIALDNLKGLESYKNERASNKKRTASRGRIGHGQKRDDPAAHPARSTKS